MTPGPGFRHVSRVLHALPATVQRPVLHTAPGLVAPDVLPGARPLGTTVVLSPGTAAVLSAAGFDDVRVVPPALPLERWPWSPRPATGRPVVLFAGHHDVEGGADEAVRAAATAGDVELRLAMRARSARQAAVEQRRLRDLAKDVGLRELVFCGEVDDMPTLVREATLVILPALALAGKADVPFVLLEAMASGRPVVASDLPSLAALGDAPVLVPPGDVPAVARAVRRLVCDDQEWDRRSRLGRRHVEAAFGTTATLRAFEELYRELLARR